MSGRVAEVGRELLRASSLGDKVETAMNMLSKLIECNA